MSYEFPDHLNQWEDGSFSIKFPDGAVLTASFIHQDYGSYSFFVHEGDKISGFSHIFHSRTDNFIEAIDILNRRTEHLRKIHFERTVRYSDIYDNMSDEEKKTFDELSDKLTALPELKPMIDSIQSNLKKSGGYTNTGDVAKKLHLMLLERSVAVIKNS